MDNQESENRPVQAGSELKERLGARWESGAIFQQSDLEILRKERESWRKEANEYRKALEEVDTYLDNAPTIRAIIMRALGGSA